MRKLVIALHVTVLVAVASLMLYQVAYSGDQVSLAGDILRGEADPNCPGCRRTVACSLADDIKRGVVLGRRWFGKGRGTEADRGLIKLAMEDPTFCSSFPDCKYTGNTNDLLLWARRGMTGEGRGYFYCGGGGCTVCVPVVHDPNKAQPK